MEEISKNGKIGTAAMKAGMDRKTARKYVREGKLPSEMPITRTWRTREDPFETAWPDVAKMLSDAPGLEAKTLFEWLLGKKSGQYDPGQLRTFQRRVRDWRAMHGPDKEIYFTQEHRPGEAMQTDFTWATELGITIRGEPFLHMLCHPVLPYSNWEWVTVCQSESMAALRDGMQAALVRLGRVPKFHQTDNSTAATHDLATGKRGFNDSYKDLVNHFGMKPRTIAVGESHQNGDVEALNGALKRSLKQHLLMRGSRDFETEEAYEKWLHGVLQKANDLRSRRVKKELAAMKPLSVKCLPEYTEEEVRVSSWSTIRVKRNAYSVPSRLKDEKVKVRLYENRLEIYFKGVHQLTVDRLVGRHGHRINYRHIIWSLVRKPGAFLRYKYREALFPSPVFRQAYDMLIDSMTSERDADIHYLRILHLAASTMESEVEAALELLITEGVVPEIDHVKALVSPEMPEHPDVTIPEVDLSSYDGLFEGVSL
ncbi:MAG: IS21 family transposase [Acidobacteria bacterium]|nr:MAG: IS21 family transposase [Acidobacteriota bacterium]